MSIFGAYLEDYHLIKIIIPLNTTFDKITLVGDSISTSLIIEKQESYAEELYLYTRYEQDISLHKDYQVKINDNITYHLSLGKITRSKLFDEEFYYDGPLGISYTVEQTTFKIWTPVSKEVILVLNNQKHHLKYKEKGLWEISIKGNLDMLPYYYIIRINEDYLKCLDPYGISSSENNEYNYVIDLKKTINLENRYYHQKTKAIIYEANLRDLSGNIYEGEAGYLKWLDKHDYFKGLKIDYFQFMPVFCFGGVDETIQNNMDKDFKYNWGYNPIQYNIPSGWYSSNPHDPYTRINEFKQMIKAIKDKNMGIILDVVYNHVFKYETFSLGLLVPGYVYRTNNQGFLMNSSYCGNDLRTEAKMIQKFIIDNLSFLSHEYGIDGFRLDLMGLIDIGTLNKAYTTLKTHNPDVIMYGEGWYMDTTLSMDLNGNLGNAEKIYPIGFFNDYFRNEIGGYLNGELGFICGKKLEPKTLSDLLTNASMSIMPFVDYTQTINYIECHDNLTIFDKIKKSLPNIKNEDVKQICKLGLGLVVLSKGISLIHSGQELMKTKQGSDNSYNQGDQINHFPYENINTIYDLSDYLRNIIDITKKINLDSSTSIYYKDYHYELRNKEVQIIIKNNFEYENIYFAPLTKLIFNNNTQVDEECESLNIDYPGIWILKK